MISIKARAYADGSVGIFFSDDGVGISPEYLGRVFDPFFTTKSGEGGSGLGLSITFNIVTGLLGGSISVESRYGAGSTFTITVPRVAPTTAERAGSGAEPAVMSS
jgi:signal transduction histidine kinase